MQSIGRPSSKLISNALKKDNSGTASLLHTVLTMGKHERPVQMATNIGHSPDNTQHCSKGGREQN